MRTTGTKGYVFGELALNDPSFVDRLRQGASFRLSTVAREDRKNKASIAMVAGVSVRSLSGSKSVRELTNRGRDGAISRRQAGRHVGKALESEGRGRRGATELWRTGGRARSRQGR